MSEKMFSCGIYKWTNLVTGRVLVGQTGPTVGFERRRGLYLSALRQNKYGRINSYFQRSWNKHREQNFMFEILEELPIGKFTQIEHDELLTTHEQAWLDYYREQPAGVYNQIGPANAPTRGARFKSRKKRAPVTDETRAKLSAANKGRRGKSPSLETRAKQSAALMGSLNHNYGKRMSDDARSALSETMKKIPVSAETRAKQSATKRGKKRAQETKDKISKANKGKKRTAEARQKMRDARLRYLESQKILQEKL